MGKSIFEMIEEGDCDAVDELVEKRSMKLEDFDKHGIPPLSLAVQKKDHNMVKRLLAAGADANIRAMSSAGTYAGYTPMHFAAKANDPDIMDLLFERGASPKSQAKDGWAPLHVACFHPCPEAVKWLVGKKVDLNPRNENGITPIVSLAGHAKMDALRCLLRAGASTEMRDQSGETLMHQALHVGMHKLFENSYTLPPTQIDAACCLALWGLDPDALNRDGVKSTRYIVEDFGSDVFHKVLKLLHMNGEQLRATEGNVAEGFAAEAWNYMTMLSIKNPKVWGDMGVPPQQAKDLCDYLHQFEEERQKHKEEKENPKKEPKKKRTTPLQRVGESTSEEDEDDEAPPQDNSGSDSGSVVMVDSAKTTKDSAAAATATATAASPPPPPPAEKQPTSVEELLETERRRAEAAGVKVSIQPKATAGLARGVSVSAAASVVDNVEVPVTKGVAAAVQQPVAAAAPPPLPSSLPALQHATAGSAVVERVVEKVVEVKWQAPPVYPPPEFNTAWAYQNRTAILCCIISFLVGNALTVLRC